MCFTFGDRFTQRWENYRALIRVFGKSKNAGTRAGGEAF